MPSLPAEDDADRPKRGPADLFRSDTLVVRAYRGRGSRICFVVFDPMGDDPSLDRTAFGESFFATYGYDAVHVLSAANTWYQDPDLPEALDLVRAVTAEYDRVVAYGSSMGGYAALRFSRRVGAHAVIAISPQYSILPEAAAFEKRWTGLRQRMRWLHEKPGDVLPPVESAVIFYDDRGLDGLHAAAILRDLPQAKAVPMPYAGHPAGAMLAEVGVISSAILDAAHGQLDAVTLPAAIRRERHRSGHYLYTLARRQPPWRLGLKQRLAERAVAAAPQEKVYLSYLGLVCECRGDGERALALHGQATAEPGFGPGELRLARALYRRGHPGLALAAIERAWRLLPHHGALIESIAIIGAANGRAAEALTRLAGDPRFAGRPRMAGALRRLGASDGMQHVLAIAAGRRLAARLVRLTVLHPSKMMNELATADRDG